MSSRLFAVAALAGVAVAGMFLARSLDEDLVYYLYVSEAVAMRDEFPDGRDFRLAGIVEPDSLTELGGGVSEFVVGDGAATAPVRLTRTPPPLFAEDVPVVLVGSWNGDTFVATDALIRHEESYEAPDEGNFDDRAATEQAAEPG